MCYDDLTAIDTVGTDCVNIHHAPNVLRVQRVSVLLTVEDADAHIKGVIRVQETSTSVQLTVEEGVANRTGVVSQPLEVQIFAPATVAVVGVPWTVVESQHNPPQNFVLSMAEEKNVHTLTAIR